jgi:hypothetical protein
MTVTADAAAVRTVSGVPAGSERSSAAASWFPRIARVATAASRSASGDSDRASTMAARAASSALRAAPLFSRVRAPSMIGSAAGSRDLNTASAALMRFCGSGARRVSEPTAASTTRRSLLLSLTGFRDLESASTTSPVRASRKPPAASRKSTALSEVRTKSRLDRSAASTSSAVACPVWARSSIPFCVSSKVSVEKRASASSTWSA